MDSSVDPARRTHSLQAVREWETLRMTSGPAGPRPAPDHLLAGWDARRLVIGALLRIGILVVMVSGYLPVVSQTGDAVSARIAKSSNMTARAVTRGEGPRLIGTSACRGVAIGPRESIQRGIRTHPPGTTFCLRAGVHRIPTPPPKERSEVRW